MKNKHCCEDFANNTDKPNQGFEYDSGSWHVNGCCGGGCYVLSYIKYCPFCGSKLSDPRESA